MNTNYEPLHKRVKDLQFRYHDALDNPRHPMARVIGKEMRELKADVEMGKMPRTIEHRVKVLEHQIKQAQRNDYGIMSPNDSNSFHHEFEHMSQDIRKMPHY